MRPYEISPQASRENPDPGESSRPIPAWVFVMSAVLMIICAFYIVRSDSIGASRYGDQRTRSDLASKPASASSANAQATGINGAAIYAARCIACHQATGAGLPGVFPPLAGSNWIEGPDSTLIQILLHGVQGTLTVNGTAYNGVMPPFGTQLSDAEIAAVLTHVRSHFGNSVGALSTQQVTAERAATASRSEPWNGDTDLTKLSRED
jgi:mono/diheme cytochrome c family protein